MVSLVLRKLFFSVYRETTVTQTTFLFQPSDGDKGQKPSLMDHESWSMRNKMHF